MSSSQATKWPLSRFGFVVRSTQPSPVPVQASPDDQPTSNAITTTYDEPPPRRASWDDSDATPRSNDDSDYHTARSHSDIEPHLPPPHIFASPSHPPHDWDDPEAPPHSPTFSHEPDPVASPDPLDENIFTDDDSMQPAYIDIGGEGSVPGRLAPAGGDQLPLLSPHVGRK